MSALRQPDFSTKYYSPRMPPREIAHQEQQISRQTPVKTAKVVESRTFSSSNTLPERLKILSLLQKTSFGLAIASMATSISVYVSTVQIPKLWSQEYQHLEDLQRQERQLITINETIKYQIANEAGQDSNLSVSKPESAVFVSPTEVKVNRYSTDQNQQNLIKLKHNSYGY